MVVRRRVDAVIVPMMVSMDDGGHELVEHLWRVGRRRVVMTAVLQGHVQPHGQRAHARRQPKTDKAQSE